MIRSEWLRSNWLIPIVTMTGLLILWTILAEPHHSVTAPNGRYSASISSTTVRATQDFTVLLSDENMDGIGRGTGVLLSSTTVLTCAHMLSRDHTAQSLWVYPYPESQVVHAKVVFINRPNDLALLELSSPVIGHKIPVFAKQVEIGEPIVVVGNINGYMMWFCSYGIISGEHQRWVLTDAVIHGGNSGGPWVNSRGEIVAITDVGWEDENGNNVGISGGVRAKDIQEFLQKAKQKPNLIYVMTGG